MGKKIPLPINKIDQVCVVVKDLHRSMERYTTLLGMRPFLVYTFAAPYVKEMTYRGKPVDSSIKLAITRYQGLQFELIQPIKGPTIYHEYLEHNEEGIHHFGAVVPNIDEAVKEAEAAGFEVIQSGRGYGKNGDGGYAYINTEEQLGAVFELIEIPAVRNPPEEVYPPEDWRR